MKILILVLMTFSVVHVRAENEKLDTTTPFCMLYEIRAPNSPLIASSVFPISNGVYKVKHGRGLIKFTRNDDRIIISSEEGIIEAPENVGESSNEQVKYKFPRYKNFEMECDQKAAKMIEKGHHNINLAKKFSRNNITSEVTPKDSADIFKFPLNPSFRDMGVNENQYNLALATFQSACTDGDKIVDKSKVPTSIADVAKTLGLTNPEVLGVPGVVKILLNLNKDTRIRCTEYTESNSVRSPTPDRAADR